MMTTVLLATLATTQLLTILGLVYTSLRLRSLGAHERSDADSALIGTVEELLLELEDQTARALDELGRQRAEIDSLLREVGTRPEEPPSRRTGAGRRTRAAASVVRSDGGSSAERRQRAADLRSAGYPERDIARELRVGVDEVRLLLATASARREGA